MCKVTKLFKGFLQQRSCFGLSLMRNTLNETRIYCLLMCYMGKDTRTWIGAGTGLCSPSVSVPETLQSTAIHWLNRWNHSAPPMQLELTFSCHCLRLVSNTPSMQGKVLKCDYLMFERETGRKKRKTELYKVKSKLMHWSGKFHFYCFCNIHCHFYKLFEFSQRYSEFTCSVAICHIKY